MVTFSPGQKSFLCAGGNGSVRPLSIHPISELPLRMGKRRGVSEKAAGIPRVTGSSWFLNSSSTQRTGGLVKAQTTPPPVPGSVRSGVCREHLYSLRLPRCCSMLAGVPPLRTADAE